MGSGKKPETRKKFSQVECDNILEDCFQNDCRFVSIEGKCQNEECDWYYRENCPFNNNEIDIEELLHPYLSETDIFLGGGTIGKLPAEFACDDFEPRS